MAKTPHFFKIILKDTIQQGKLGIPKKFVRTYGNYLSERVFLKLPNGSKWKVELVRIGDGVSFGNGWKQFVDHYSLSHGSFLVFGFEDFRNCTFNVLIFDRTTSEIDYLFNVQEEDNEEQVHQPINRENNNVDVRSTRISEDKSPLPFSRPCKKMKLENCTTHSDGFHQPIAPKIIEIDVSRPQKLEEKSMSPNSRPRKKMKQEIGTSLPQAKKGNRNGVVKRKQILSAEEIANAIDRASSYYKSNTLSSFSMVVHPSHVSGDFRVVIPTGFAKKYLKEQRGNIILNSVDEKSWSVGYTYAKQRGVAICRGWRKFVEDNNLEVGDVCVFEVINHNATKFKVEICRKDQYANGGPPIVSTQKLEEKSMSPNYRPWKKMKQEIGTSLPQAKRDNKDMVVKRTQKLTPEEKANALNRANCYYKSNNLSFTMVVQPSHVGGDFRVCVPASFANTYFKKQQGNIILYSVDERTWPAEYICRKQRGIKLARVCRGWRKFVEDNHLEVGDVCIFEVINCDENKLKVIICRKDQDASGSPLIVGVDQETSSI